MAGGFTHIIMRKQLDKRLSEKLSRVDDIFVLDEDVPRDCMYSFVDFAPFLKTFKNEIKIQGIRCPRFSELIEFSNKWLQKNECWDVIGCEAIPAIIEVVITDRGQIEHKQILTTFTITDDMSQKAEMAYKLSNNLSQSRVPVEFHVLILRLWIKRLSTTSPKDKLRPIIPQLRSIDFAPKHINDNEFESIDAVVERINQSIRNEEIHGKIISVQTLACSAQKDWSIEENSTQAQQWIGRFVYILRVYYLLGPIHEDEIGFADFVPECLSGGNLFKRPKFESQTEVLNKASKWLSENPEINFCSTSSIDIKLNKMVSIDTKQMAITRGTGDFIRILRLVYTKPKDPPEDVPMSSTLPPPPPLYLESRALVLHKSYYELKKILNDFMSRKEWRAEHQYKWVLLNCETVFIMSHNNLKSSLETNCEQSFQSISSSKISMNRNIYYAIKLYFDVGFYGVDQIKAKSEDQNPIHSSRSCALI